MDTYNQTTETFDGRKKELPGMLNVLTILTFIGCALSYFGTIYGFLTAGKGLEDLEGMEDTDNEMVNEMARGSLDIAQKSYDNRYILLVSGLLFTTMCLIGAMQMRKLKKSGYLIYVIGEIAPVILTAVLIGFSMVGGITTAVGAFFALLFVILYTTQRKYLVNP